MAKVSATLQKSCVAGVVAFLVMQGQRKSQLHASMYRPLIAHWVMRPSSRPRPSSLRWTRSRRARPLPGPDRAGEVARRTGRPSDPRQDQAGGLRLGQASVFYVATEDTRWDFRVDATVAPSVTRPTA